MASQQCGARFWLAGGCAIPDPARALASASPITFDSRPKSRYCDTRLPQYLGIQAHSRSSLSRRSPEVQTSAVEELTIALFFPPVRGVQSHISFTTSRTFSALNQSWVTQHSSISSSLNLIGTTALL